MTYRRKVFHLPLVLLTLCLSLLLPACSKNHSDAVSILQLQLETAQPRLAVGSGCNRLFAHSVDSRYEHHDVSASVQWQNLNSDLVNLTQNTSGQPCLQPIAAGLAQITANMDGVSATLDITIVNTALSRLEIAPQTWEQPKSAPLALKATAIYGDQHKQDVTDQVTWTTPTGVTETNGWIENLSSVSGTNLGISAGLAGVSGSTNITLNSANLQQLILRSNKQQLPVGTSARLQVFAQFSDGSQLDVTPFVSWTLSPAALGRIESVGNHARLTASQGGSATLNASWNGQSTNLPLQLIDTPLESLQLRYDFPPLPVGEQANVSAIARFANHLRQEVTDDVTWLSETPAQLQISNRPGAAGSVRAIAAGDTTVHAHLAGKQAQLSIRSHQAALSSLELSSPVYYLAQGRKSQVNALAHYADGSVWRLSDKVIWQTDSAYASIGNDQEHSGLLVAQTESTTPSFISASYLGVSSQLAYHPVSASIAGLTRVELYTSRTSLPLGVATELSAIGIYLDGSKQDISHEVNWLIDQPNLVNLQRGDGHAELTALAAGNIVVSATLPGAIISSQIQLTLSNPALTGLNFASQPFTQPAGFESDLSIIGEYDNGEQGELASRVQLSVTDSSIAEIFYDQQLRPHLRGLKQGQTTLTASLDGQSVSQNLDVASATLIGLNLTPAHVELALGLNQALKLTAQFSDGSVVDVSQQAQWRSQDQSVASVTPTPSGALLSSTGLGSTKAVASYQGEQVLSDVVVSAATLDSIDVTPAGLSLPLGLPQQFSAYGHYSDGSLRDITQQALWSVDNSALAQISNQNSGYLQTLAQGNVRVSATLGAITSNADITISGATLRATNPLELANLPTNLPKGTTHQLTLYGYYTDGSRRDLTAQAGWSSSAPTLLAVQNSESGKGRLQAEALGSATISATVGSSTVSSVLEVSEAALVRLALDARYPALPKGLTARFAATAIYSDNSQQTITSLVNWSSNNGQLATPTTVPGEFKTHAAGEVTVSAQWQGQLVSQRLSIVDATLNPAGIVVTPSNSTIGALSLAQFLASGSYSDGNVYDLTEQVLWSSSQPLIGISSGMKGGLALSTGPTPPYSGTLTAALAGETATATLTVAADTITAITVDSLQIDPARTSVSADADLLNGVTLPLRAQASYNTLGQSVVTQRVIWSSSDSNVVSVSNAPGSEGVITTKQVGSATIYADFGSLQGSYNIVVSEDLTKVNRLVTWAVPSMVVQGERVALCVAPLNANNERQSTQGLKINGGSAPTPTLSNKCKPNSVVSFNGISAYATNADTNLFVMQLDSLDATLVNSVMVRSVAGGDLAQSVGVQQSYSPLWDGSTLKAGSEFSITVSNATGRDYSLFAVQATVYDANGNLIPETGTEVITDPLELSDGKLLGNETFRLVFTLDYDYPAAKKVVVTYQMSATLTFPAGNQVQTFYPTMVFDLP